MKPLHNIKDAAHNIRLSNQEKSVMRAQLMEMIRLSQPAERAVKTPYFFFAYQRAAMSFALVALVLIGGTTTYAAQGSLPGGVLYPVKIYVNENVQEVLAVSDVAKVSFHTSVAQERLKEAEALANEGKLDAQVATEIETNFNEHVAKAENIATTLEENDIASGVNARVTLDSSLAVHGTILARIGDSSKDVATKENSNSFATKVHSRAQGGVVVALAATAPVAMQTMAFSVESAEDASTSGSSTAGGNARTMVAAKATNTATVTATVATTASQKKIAFQLQQKAGAQFHTAKENFGDARWALSASTTAKANAKFILLGNRLESGKSDMKKERYESARAAFTEVIQGSVELATLINASKLYKQDFVRSLLWDDTDDSHDPADTEDRDGEVKGVHTDASVTSTSSTPPAPPDASSTQDTEDTKGDIQVHVGGGLDIKLPR